MSSFSCSLRVNELVPQDEGVTAYLEYQEGGGVDINPETFSCQFTDEAAAQFRKDDIIKMTLETVQLSSRIGKHFDAQAKQRSDDMRELQGGGKS